MAIKSLTNLLLAGGNSATSGGMSFKYNMPNQPLPSGRSFLNYSLNSITNNSRSFDTTTPIRNYKIFEWRINTVPDVPNNFINDLVGKSASINIGNVTLGDGTPSPSDVYVTNTSFTYSQGGMTASARIENARTVFDYTGALNVNAYNTFTATVTYVAGPTFNDVKSLILDDIKVRPSISGQGAPATSPSAPTSLNTTYPASTNFLLVTAAMDGWIAGDLNYELQWSLDNFATTISGDNTGTLIYIGPVGDPGTGITYTIYARARVTDPYVSPWSSVTSVTWTDPRAP